MANLSACAVIVLDLDDTLFLERDYVRSGFAAVDEWLRTQGIMADFQERAWQCFESGVRQRIFNVVFEAQGAHLSVTMLQNLIEVYRSHSPQIALLPDADRLLDRVAKHKLGALISDGPLQSQVSKVEALDLSSRLQTIVLTDRWGKEFWKPHKRSFETIENAHAGVPSARIAYVADNPAKDFVTPKVRGWRTVRICHVGGQHSSAGAKFGFEADECINSLDQICINSSE